MRLHRAAAAAPLPSATPRASILNIQQLKRQSGVFQARNFRAAPAFRKGITPDSEDPKAPNPQSSNAAAAAGAIHVVEPTSLSDKDYHEVSEHYLNVLLGELERIQEEGSEIEAEYSVCCSTCMACWLPAKTNAAFFFFFEYRRSSW